MRHVQMLGKTVGPAATVAFSSAMTPYAPATIPLYTDMVDVDSEKWFDYGRVRFGGFLYRIEGSRLRQVERECTARARCTWITTRQERNILEGIAPGSTVRDIENGIDTEYFDPSLVRVPHELAGRQIALFVGAMDYYPNVDACCRFALEILPELRKRAPRLEFFIVGRDPNRAVRRLGALPGVTVTGTVPDVRPYVAAARVSVASLRVARGMQNKVLEALSMGKRVLASPAVCATFGSNLPVGIFPCASSADYADALSSLPDNEWEPEIRRGVEQRFSWSALSHQVYTDLEDLTFSMAAIARS
jgi:sugar transferase (PEP-CTERM/EpsH1 system associated)